MYRYRQACVCCGNWEVQKENRGGEKKMANWGFRVLIPERRSKVECKIQRPAEAPSAQKKKQQLTRNSENTNKRSRQKGGGPGKARWLKRRSFGGGVRPLKKGNLGHPKTKLSRRGQAGAVRGGRKVADEKAGSSRKGRQKGKEIGS